MRPTCGEVMERPSVIRELMGNDGREEAVRDEDY